MLALAHAATTLGVEGHLVRVEADSSPGTPSFTLIGLPDRALAEARDRVRAAIFHSGFLFPAGRLLVNLAPADLRKAGTGFDLPVALALLAIDEQVGREALSRVVAIGELALDGTVRPVGGVLPMVIGARRAGLSRILVPRANVDEATLVERVTLYAIEHLAEAIAVLLGSGERFAVTRSTVARPLPTPRYDFADVRGQAVAKRALEIAAAGGHHVRLIGPPGCGKTMLAQRLPSILPAMSEDEALTVTAIRSAAGLPLPAGGWSVERPFRAPHHTITQQALIGGGRYPAPGEASLAHHGVLFLDELPEFARATLEVLRQPLEDGVVTIGRVAGVTTYPTRFTLIVAMNPCPCGLRGQREGECRCDDSSVARYLSRLSGPLLDRIDLRIPLARLSSEELASKGVSESSCRIRERVEAARERQRQRAGQRGDVLNATASPTMLRSESSIKPDALQLLQRIGESSRISARAFDRLLRVARTIGDIAGHERILTDDVAEAFSYR